MILMAYLLVFLSVGLLRSFPLKVLGLGLEDVRILSGAAAGAVGPVSLRLGAELRAHL